jgi:hypothetical protein
MPALLQRKFEDIRIRRHVLGVGRSGQRNYADHDRKSEHDLRARPTVPRGDLGQFRNGQRLAIGGQLRESMVALAQALPGERVVLRPGEYRLDGPGQFPRGGEKGRPITLYAAPGEFVALLGSVRLTGWEISTLVDSGSRAGRIRFFTVRPEPHFHGDTT